MYSVEAQYHLKTQKTEFTAEEYVKLLNQMILHSKENEDPIRLHLVAYFLKKGFQYAFENLHDDEIYQIIKKIDCLSGNPNRFVPLFEQFENYIPVLEKYLNKCQNCLIKIKNVELN